MFNSVDNMAQAKGLSYHDYDTALPQEWVDNFYRVTGIYPVGMFVWSYKNASIFGEPYPLTDEAKNLLESYNA